MAVFYDPDDVGTFVFDTDDVLEFVNAESQGASSDILQGVSILGCLPPFVIR